MRSITFLRDFFKFLRQSKQWWLMPVFFLFVLIGTLLVAAQTSVLAPFLYTLF